MKRLLFVPLLLLATLLPAQEAPQPAPAPKPVPVWNGWKLSRFRDSRKGPQKYFAPAKFRMAAPPGHFDLRPTQPPIYDQGALGSCVDNGVARLLHTCQINQKWATTWVPSRLYGYYWARALEGTVNQDSGSSVEDGVKAIALKGTVPEEMWPYVISQFTVQPPASVVKAAAPNIISDYGRCPDNDRASITAAISSGHPVAFGFDVYSNFPRDASTGGVVPMPAGQVEGGHCVTIVGYNFDSSLPGVPNGYYIVANSWGTGWGDKGYCYFPAAMIERSQYSSDFWIIASIPGGTPMPPGPTPPVPPTPPIPVVQYDVGITLASKTVTVPAGWRAYQGQRQQSYIITDPPSKVVVVPTGWKVVRPSQEGLMALPWGTILTVVEDLLEKYGPAAAPIVEKLVANLGLPAFMERMIDRMIEAALNPPRLKKAG